MSSAPSHGPSAHSAPAGKPKGYLGMSRGMRLALIGAPTAAWLCASAYGLLPGNGCGNPDPAEYPDSPYAEPKPVDVANPALREEASLANGATRCHGAKKYQLQEAMELRDKMITLSAVQTALSGRSGDLKKPSYTGCYPGDAVHRGDEVDAWLIADGQVHYANSFFEQVGQAGNCNRAATEVALEACARFGGCEREHHQIQVGPNIPLPDNIKRAKELAMKACMNWTL